MINKNSFFFMLFVAQITFCASNLHCVLNAFDEEKQELTKRLSESTFSDPTNSKNTLRKSLNSPNKIIEESAEKPKKKSLMNSISNFFKAPEPEMRPVMLQIIAQIYLQKNFVKIPLEYKKWIDEQCLSYVKERVRIQGESEFLCEQLTKQKSKAVQFMMKHQNIGHNLFGTVIAISASILFENIEKRPNFYSSAKNEQELKKSKIVVEDYYKNLLKDFLENFDKSYNEIIENSILKKIAEYYDLENFLSILMNKEASEIEPMKNTISLMIGLIALPKNADSVQIVKNVLTEYKKVLTNDPTSITFTRIGDKIKNRLKKKTQVRHLLQNVVLPSCLLKGATFNLLREDLFLTACRNLIEKIAVLCESRNSFGVHVLESPQSLDFLIQNINQGIFALSQTPTKDYSSLEKSVIIVFESYMKQISQTFDKYQALIPNDRFSIEQSLPLIISITDILETKDVDSNNLFDNLFLNQYEMQIRQNIFDSDQIEEFIEFKRSAIIRSLGSIGHTIKSNVFLSKLKTICYSNKSSSLSQLCLRSIQNVNFDDFVKYGQSESIFTIMDNAFTLKMNKYDTKISEEDVLLALAESTFQTQMIEFKSIHEQFVAKNTAFCQAHSNDKCMMYVLVARQLINQDILVLPDSFSSEIIEWGVQNFHELENLKIKHKKFDAKLQELKTYLSYKISKSSSFVGLSNQQSTHLKSIDLFGSSLTEEEQKAIKSKLKTIVYNYNYLPNTIKNKLQKCQMASDDVHARIIECQVKNKGRCTHINEFMIGKQCPNGMSFDAAGNCLADCPTNFKALSTQACEKPLVTVAVPNKNDFSSLLKCPENSYQEGLLCFYRCPQFWKDIGSSCAREVIPIDFENAMMLIE